ncbi:MAG: TonB-dependent receptor [Rubrivivax sp.]|nr:MAG: TonB-dependent receptor [Rubrivivax sp.]
MTHVPFKSWPLTFVATAALLATCAWAAPVHAQSKDEAGALADLSLEELMRVEIVSASRRTQLLSDVPDAVHVITRDDILRSGARSLPEVLRMAPGVDVAQMSPSSWAVGVRGEAGRFANKLQVLIDGRSIFSPLYSGVIWEAERVPLEDIERIEVIRGPAGAVWGTNAVNGVINIITREAERTQGTQVAATVGTDGSDRLLVQHGLATGAKSWLRLYGQADRQADGIDSRGANANNRAHVETMGLRWDQSGADGSRLSAQGQFLRSVKRGTLPFPSFANLLATDSVQTIDRAIAMLALDKPISSESELHVQASAQHQRTQQEGYAEHRANSVDLDVQHRWHPGGSRHDIIWGAGITGYEDRVQSIDFVTFEPNHRTLVNGRIFGQHEYALVPNELLLTYGARVDHDRYSGAQAAPNARLLWKMDDHSSSWLAVSRAVRAPARGEADLGVNLPTTVNGDPVNVRAIINPGARIVEKVLALESGWRSQVRQNLSIDVAAFVQRYNPLLGIKPDIVNATSLDDLNVVGDEVINGNRVITVAATSPARATTHGIELAADWRISRFWRQQLAYSYMETHFARPKIISTMGGTPRTLISLRESFDLNSQWMLDLWLRYTSARKDPLVPSLDVPSRTAMDVNLRWLVAPTATISLGAHNLGPRYTDQINPRISSKVERAAFAKVEASF